MSELIAVRGPRGEVIDAPGTPLAALPVTLSALDDRDLGVWCGDFNVAGHGFGHLKVLRCPPPLGSFGLRGDTVHVMLVCDGFHRGLCSDPELRLVMVLGPLGLDAPGGEALRQRMTHAEMTVVTRAAFQWRFQVCAGKAPELQLAAVNLIAADLCTIAGETNGIEVFFRLTSPRGQGYINRDGVPGRNFVIGRELFCAKSPIKKCSRT